MPLPAPIVFGSPACTPPLARAAVAVGNFDGVHLGHAAIAGRLIATAGRLGAPAIALTFDPHPASLVRPGQAPAPLTTPARRAELLLALGLDAVLVQPTDAAFVSLSADEFFGRILRDQLGGIAFVEGEDFRFGAGRAGDIPLLRRLAAAAGASVEVVEAVSAGDETVSSSRLRALLLAGDVAAARALATAAYRLTGIVEPGARRGAGLGFPTANLGRIATLVPAAGVYAGRARLAGPGEPGDWFPAAVNIGTSPTFETTTPTVEAHLVGFTGDCYGRGLDVDFLARLRDTRRFASVEDLKTQLADDVSRAVAIASGRPAPAPET